MLMFAWYMWSIMVFMFIGFIAGYKDGKKDQQEILVRLRKQIANNKG